MSTNHRPHPGDCPHHPDDRRMFEEPFVGGFRVECLSCGLSGATSRAERNAKGSFSEAVTRERRKRRAEYYEEKETESFERLMREPPAGTRIIRGRTV